MHKKPRCSLYIAKAKLKGENHIVQPRMTAKRQDASGSYKLPGNPYMKNVLACHQQNHRSYPNDRAYVIVFYRQGTSWEKAALVFRIGITLYQLRIRERKQLMQNKLLRKLRFKKISLMILRSSHQKFNDPDDSENWSKRLQHFLECHYIPLC